MSFYLKCFLLILLYFGIASKVQFAYSQQLMFSQYYSAGAFLNSASIAEKNGFEVGLNNRTNINKNLSPYTLRQVSLVFPIKLPRLTSRKYYNDGYLGGLGLSLYNENQGVYDELQNIGGMFTLGYLARLSLSSYLSFGAQVGFNFKKLDLGKLSWGSQFDPTSGYDENIVPSLGDLKESVFFGKINAGLIYRYSPMEIGGNEAKFSFFQGLAVSNLNKPNESFFSEQISALPYTYKIHGGVKYKITKEIEILPNYLWMFQDQKKMINFGLYLNYAINHNNHKQTGITLGSWYRLGDSFILLCGLFSNNWTIGLSYDFNVSSLSIQNQSPGAFEINISYKVFRKNRPRNISDPLL